MTFYEYAMQRGGALRTPKDDFFYDVRRDGLFLKDVGSLADLKVRVSRRCGGDAAIIRAAAAAWREYERQGLADLL